MTPTWAEGMNEELNVFPCDYLMLATGEVQTTLQWLLYYLQLKVQLAVPTKPFASEDT